LALFGRRPAQSAERLVVAGVQKPEQQRTHALQQDALFFGFALEAMAAGSVQ
jgi:hypothetical protein